MTGVPAAKIIVTELKYRVTRRGLSPNFASNNKQIDFYSPRNHKKTYSFLMISGGGDRSQLIRLNSLNIRSRIWRQSLAYSFPGTHKDILLKETGSKVLHSTFLFASKNVMKVSYIFSTLNILKINNT